MPHSTMHNNALDAGWFQFDTDHVAVRTQQYQEMNQNVAGSISVKMQTSVTVANAVGLLTAAQRAPRLAPAATHPANLQAGEIETYGGYGGPNCGYTG